MIYTVVYGRVAWTCLTESIVNRDLLSRVFAANLPSAGCGMLCDWFLPKTMVEQVKQSVAFDAANMEKGEKPIKYFGRDDKICWSARFVWGDEIGSSRQPQNNHDTHLRL